MTFTFSEEQSLLRDAARSFMIDRAAVSRFRKMRDERKNGRDPDLWREMVELGWSGIIVPEQFGGVGLGYVGLGLVLEEAGRKLVSSPLLSTALIGTSAILLGGNDIQKSTWLPRLVNGNALAALAVDETAHHAPDRVIVAATNTGHVYSLSGQKRFVADGHIADLIIVPARASGNLGDAKGVALFLVQGDAKGLTRQELVTVDSRGAADMVFDNVPAEPLGDPAIGSQLLEQILDRGRIGLAAEMLGQAAEEFEIIGEYLKTRRQFGQLIGGFQALQHRAARMFTDIELTRSCVIAALDALDRNADNIPEWSSLAKARASDTLHLVSNETVQMLGGIGMTDAHDAGLYLKRARVAEGLYGGSSFHRDRYARLLGF